MTIRRKGATFVGSAAVVVAAVVTVLAGQRLPSQEQLAADAAPPSPSLVTVAAERRALAEPVVLRGQVKPGASVKLLPPPGAVGATSVVTAVPVRRGQTLKEGMVLLERAGEPLLVMALRFPLWRDLTGGVTGPDVTEVQRLLNRAGYRVKASGRWDPPTQRALGWFLGARGYPAPGGGPEAQSQLAAAVTAREQAQREYDAAVVAKAGVAAAKSTLTAAGKAVEAAELAAGPALPVRYVARITKPRHKVTAVAVRVGAVLTDPQTPLVELDSSGSYLVTTIAADKVSLVSVGQRATVTDEVAGTTAEATVTAVGKDVATGAAGVEVRLAFNGRQLAAAEDRTMRVELIAATAEEEVLAVPVSAVYARPDGTLFVTVAEPGGSVIDVTVVIGQIAGGWVAITPKSDLVRPGTAVVVGEEAADLTTAR